MAPKRGRPSAKAKARAKALVLKNSRRHGRRLACHSLNDLARALHLSETKLLDSKNAPAADVENLVRLLEKRANTPEHMTRLRGAAQRYLDNGGVFSTPLLDEEEVLPPAVAKHRLLKPNFELRSRAFMLTYNSAQFSRDTWKPFLTFVKKLKRTFGARGYSACLELSLHAADNALERVHVHAYLLWTDGVGVHCKDLSPFNFEGVRPRIDVCTTMTKTVSPHSAACHGLWYVWVMKSGTLFSATNYEAGIWYKPQAQWLQNLYQDKKLTYALYMEMSAKDFPLGHSARKRDADEALRDAKRLAVEKHVDNELKELQEGGMRFQEQDLSRFPEIVEFVKLFREEHWRRPILLIVGATHLGKSMLAGKVLREVGKVLHMADPSFVEVTVEGDAHIDFSDFDVEKHAGVLLDGVSDALCLKRARETLQGRPKVVKGAKSATMKFSYPFTLTRRAVVATMDLSADNLYLLKKDHWLSDRRNVLQVHLNQTSYGSASVTQPSVSREDEMKQWAVCGVVSFLKGEDLEGSASAFFANNVSGADLVNISQETLIQDLRLSAFAARKVLTARDAFLRV